MPFRHGHVQFSSVYRHGDGSNLCTIIIQMNCIWNKHVMAKHNGDHNIKSLFQKHADITPIVFCRFSTRRASGYTRPTCTSCGVGPVCIQGDESGAGNHQSAVIKPFQQTSSTPNCCNDNIILVREHIQISLAVSDFTSSQTVALKIHSSPFTDHKSAERFSDVKYIIWPLWWFYKDVILDSAFHHHH